MDHVLANHQDILRQHFFAQIVYQLLAAPPVAECDGTCALGIVLADDIAIELGTDFARREIGHGLQAFDDDVFVGVDADIGRDFHRPAGNFLRLQSVLAEQAAGGGKRDRPTRAAPNPPVFGF